MQRTKQEDVSKKLGEMKIDIGVLTEEAGEYIQ